jgi:hypothetical protein
MSKTILVSPVSSPGSKDALALIPGLSLIFKIALSREL